MSSAEAHDVVIIGAGFCGLATAAALKRRGISRFAILEQGADVGHFWSGAYDRIRLHSAWHDLPNDGGLSAKYPMYKARDELLHYFRAYADRFDLRSHLRCGEKVTHIRRAETGARSEWDVETNEHSFSARFLTVATAINRSPVRPVLPEQDRFGGRVLHSGEYRNPAPFRGQRVVVVGSGNSAAEIALDLAENGAESVAMWVRGPRHFIPIRATTVLFRVLRALGGMSPKQVDASHRLTVGTPEFEKVVRMRDKLPRYFSVDLSAFGIRKPARGPMEEALSFGRIAVFDQGAIPAIRQRRIRVIDGHVRPITGFASGGIRLGDDVEFADAVILATGFAPHLEEFLDDHRTMLGPVRWHRSAPLTDGRSRSRVFPSAFFPGFDPSVNGGLSLGRWGWEAGERIAEHLRPA